MDTNDEVKSRQNDEMISDAAGGSIDISSEPVMEPINAIPKVTVVQGGMAAELTIYPPRFGGVHTTAEEIQAALGAAGVVFGINQDLLESLAKYSQYDKAFEIARGVEAVEGTPARLEYKVRLSKDLKPKENEDGTVDYRDLGLIQNVRENEVLCEKIPAGKGTPGRTVLGVELPSKPGRDIALPLGNNTKLSEDQLRLMASCDGQVDLVGARLNVLNTFTVNGDVGNATGNIDFVGNLIIHGNILASFTVQASGSITVNGSVEDATVIAGGNIVLKEGIHGGGTDSSRIVQAGGYIKSKYIQYANVVAGGDVESLSIQHSQVQCHGSVSVLGSRGRVAGGRISARNNIRCTYAGGKTSSISTTLEVGNNPETAARSRQLEVEIETMGNQMNSLRPAISMLEELEKAGALSGDRQEALNQARTAYQSMSANVASLQQEQKAVRDELASLGYGSVSIKQEAYPGVHIIIGSETMPLDREYTYTSFIRGEKGITFVPYQE